MDNTQLLTWAMGAVGIFGFFMAGKKKWWCWYVNLACQALWVIYAIVTSQPAFLITALFYTWVFGKNALMWTKEHLKKETDA